MKKMVLQLLLIVGLFCLSMSPSFIEASNIEQGKNYTHYYVQ